LAQAKRKLNLRVPVKGFWACGVLMSRLSILFFAKIFCQFVERTELPVRKLGLKSYNVLQILGLAKLLRKFEASANVLCRVLP
jgi:hypothetical protein